MFKQINPWLTVPSSECTTIELNTDRAFLNNPFYVFYLWRGSVRVLWWAAILTFFWILAVILPDVLPRDSTDSQVEGPPGLARRKGEETLDMRHTLIILAASAALAAISGCACNNCCNSCNSGVHKAASQQPPGQQAASG